MDENNLIKKLDRIKDELIKNGSKFGYITFEELAESLIGLELTEEMLNDIYTNLLEKGISVISTDDSDEDAEIDEKDDDYNGFSEIDEVIDQTILYCPKCGITYDDDTTICPNCDELLTTDDNDPKYKSFMENFIIAQILKKYEYPNELLNNKRIHDYLLYSYNVSNVDMLINKIIDNDYIRHPNDFEILNTYKVSDLKNILKENDERVSGKKQDLIERIINSNINYKNEVYNHIKNYYIISETGKKYIDYNTDLINLGCNYIYQISPKDFYRMKCKMASENQEYNYNDCVLNILTSRVEKAYSEKDYDRLYYNYRNIAYFMETNNRFREALIYNLKCFIYDMCGIRFYNLYSLYRDGYYDKDYLVENIKNNYLETTSINSILKYRDFYSDNLLEIEYNNLEMDFKLCSYAFIKKLLSDALNSSLFDLNDYKEVIIRERINNLKNYL